MTVKELKILLENLPDDMLVVQQRDPEGNGYSPTSGADPEAVYHDGDVYNINWSAEDCCLDDDEWEELLSGPRCLVIYPMY